MSSFSLIILVIFVVAIIVISLIFFFLFLNSSSETAPVAATLPPSNGSQTNTIQETIENQNPNVSIDRQNTTALRQIAPQDLNNRREANAMLRNMPPFNLVSAVSDVSYEESSNYLSDSEDSEDEPIFTTTTHEGNRFQRPVPSSPAVRDLIEYFSELVCLYDDSTICIGPRKVKTSIDLERLSIYCGVLIALSSGSLYYLSSNFQENFWHFDSLISAPDLVITNNSQLAQNLDELHRNKEKIIDLNTTLSFDHLTVQTCSSFRVYDCSGKRVLNCAMEPTVRRIYGNDLANYLEIDRNTAKMILYPSKKQYCDIIEGALNYNGKVYIVNLNMYLKRGYTAVRIINWKAYLLSGKINYPLAID